MSSCRKLHNGLPLELGARGSHRGRTLGSRFRAISQRPVGVRTPTVNVPIACNALRMPASTAAKGPGPRGLEPASRCGQRRAAGVRRALVGMRAGEACQTFGSFGGVLALCGIAAGTQFPTHDASKAWVPPLATVDIPRNPTMLRSPSSALASSQPCVRKMNEAVRKMNAAPRLRAPAGSASPRANEASGKRP